MAGNRTILEWPRRRRGIRNIAVGSIGRLQRHTVGRSSGSQLMQARFNGSQALPAPTSPAQYHAMRGIRRAVLRRGISRLFHFTRVENIESIQQHGLLSRRLLSERGVEAVVNDLERRDGHLDRISVSVGFPNSRLMKAWKMMNPTAVWAVLALRPVVLWDQDCLFCPGNAASRRIQAMAPEALRGAAALEELFRRDMPAAVAEKDRQDWPTEVQAEVLVHGAIDPSRIECIYFERPSVLRRFSGTLPHELLRANPGFFGARS